MAQVTGREFIQVRWDPEVETREEYRARINAELEKMRPHDPFYDLPGMGRPLVYYLSFADRIKIGFSTDLRGRSTAIPHDEVLGYEEPGSYQLESRRHKQFSHLRVDMLKQREWFYRAPELIEHINQHRPPGKPQLDG